MTELTLVSTHGRSLKSLVKAAIENELRLLDAGVWRAEQRIKLFEAQYRLKTPDFIARYENDELEETLEFAEWIGESRLLTRMREKADTLRGVTFAN
jgi:hypothetical protein